MKRLNVPHYADNLKERLLSFFSRTKSDQEERQLYGVLLASAYSTRNESVISNIVYIARDYVDVSTINAAKSAAALAEIKLDYKGLPRLESDIYIYSHNEGYVQAFDVPTTPAEIKENQKDDMNFQLFLLAASFITDFDNYLKMLKQQKSGSTYALNTVIPIAAIIQTIAEIT
ncbi:MAG: hypothetical protein GQ532_12585 [Methylomarinum sp.]|nr:hypothetical protein [Methylomarinum sp.]